jgi:hypothetical protein
MHDQYIFDIYVTEHGEFSLRKVRSSFLIKRSWMKLISNGVALPLPSRVENFHNIPGKIINQPVINLLPGDIVLEGYELESFNGKKGVRVFPWIYRISGFDRYEKFFSFERNWNSFKTQMRHQGMQRDLLAGKKTLAAMVRVAHAMRQGMILTESSAEIEKEKKHI